MRIIQIIDLPWYNACAEFAVKQAKALHFLGHDLLLMANPGTPVVSKAREAGLNVSEEVNFKGVLRVFSAARSLKKIAKEFRADIIFAHRGESHLVSALVASELPIARFRGDVRPPRGNIFSRYLNTRLTDGVAVSTERLKIEYEKKFGANCIPYRVIYPGLDSARFKVNMPKGDLKRKFGLKPEAPVVGIVGRISSVKGHRYFIEAAKLVSLKIPRAQYVIAGEDVDGDLAKLQIAASVLKVPNIKFLGRIANVEELISSFDIGVVSSIGSEMISRVLLEYFAAGLPVVATSINQISEIMLQSDGGILVPPADPVTMGNATIDLLNDQTKRLRLGGNGERWVAGRSLDVFGRESEAFLREVLNAQ